MGFVLYAVAALASMVVLDLAYAAGRWALSGRAPFPYRGLARRIDERREARKPLPEPVPPVLLGLELRRLGEEVRRIADSDLPAKRARLTACTAAYDDVLIRACRSVGVQEPPGPLPLPESRRFEAESALVAAGFDW
jgi:hypothetical protein